MSDGGPNHRLPRLQREKGIASTFLDKWGKDGLVPFWPGPSPSQLTEGRGLAHLLVPSTHSQVKDGKLEQRATGGPSAVREEQLVMPHEGGSSLGSDPLLTSKLLLGSQNLSGSLVGLLQAVDSPWDPS